MLDLKKLEEKLDQALAQESRESLTNWLQEKRAKNYLQSLGKGAFENKAKIFLQIIPSKSNVSFSKLGRCETTYSELYPQAA